MNPVSGGESAHAAWTPDGRSVIYRRDEGGLYRQPADGSEGAQLLVDLERAVVARVMDISRNGIVAFATGSPQDDIQTLNLETGKATPARENGSTLYYRGSSGDMMSVPVTLSPTFTSGRPRTLFRFAGVYRMSGTATAYDIHPDGKRFIMVSERKDAAATPRQQVNIVLNWFEELCRARAHDTRRPRKARLYWKSPVSDRGTLEDVSQSRIYRSTCGRKLLILNGEMSEWSIEHAWKLL